VRYLQAFREPAVAAAFSDLIAREVDASREYRLMEFCGGHTHAIFHFGVQDLLPDNVQFVHGPGCPVCVLALPRLNAAIELAQSRDIILVTYGDMMRVPASRRQSLLKARAQGSDVRMTLSSMDALEVAIQNPAREVVFFAIGFETTTPATAYVVQVAQQRRIRNFSVYCNHVVTPAAMRAILDVPVACESNHSPGVRVDGFLGPSHVSTLIGSAPYEFVADQYRRPVVISGFEPLDVMQSVHMLIKQINASVARVENQFTRGVTRHGNAKARAIMADVFEVREAFEWRGLGELPHSGLRIKSKYQRFDAEHRFEIRTKHATENAACQCPAIIRGVKKPTDCSIFGTTCTPRSPIGACMVSSEGACAAHYKYRRVALEVVA
jgi:hydrogenase expression/formation protein HypD